MALTSACAGSTMAARGALPLNAQPLMPRLRGASLTGTAIDTRAWHAQALVVNVWGSWCAPCRKETPDLVRLATSYRTRPVQFLGLDVRDDTAAALAFARRYDVAYPSIAQADGLLSALPPGMAPPAVPATYVVAPNGRIVARYFGATTADELGAVLAQITS